MFNACLAPAPPTQTQDGGQGLPAKQVHSPTALKKDDWMGIAKQVHPPTALKKDDLMGEWPNPTLFVPQLLRTGASHRPGRPGR